MQGKTDAQNPDFTLPYHQVRTLRALTSPEKKRLDDMRKGCCDWTVDPRLQEMRAALTGIILDDLRLRRKLINLGVDVAPARRR